MCTSYKSLFQTRCRKYVCGRQQHHSRSPRLAGIPEPAPKRSSRGLVASLCFVCFSTSAKNANMNVELRHNGSYRQTVACTMGVSHLEMLQCSILLTLSVQIGSEKQCGQGRLPLLRSPSSKKFRPRESIIHNYEEGGIHFQTDSYALFQNICVLRE